MQTSQQNIVPHKCECYGKNFKPPGEPTNESPKNDDENPNNTSKPATQFQTPKGSANNKTNQSKGRKSYKYCNASTVSTTLSAVRS